jgi:hypothetical protein
MATYRSALTLCPTCGYNMDTHTLLDKYDPPEPPLPGDMAVCAKCGEILVFDPDQGANVHTQESAFG